MQNYQNLKYFFLIFFILSYIIGFFLRENIAGGAEQDFLSFTWPAILSFKNDFYFSIKNYGSFGEGSLPLFHIINAYLNPFTFDQFAFQGSITLISLLNVIIFSQIIEKKFKLKKIDALLYASIFLILPFFRSSAFWGITENFGWLFLLISIKYYNYYNENKNQRKFSTIFLICLFSSLALYVRPYLIFFPIFLILNSVFNKDYNYLKPSIILYLVFSIPGFILIYLWEGVLKLGNDEINLVKDYHNPKFISKNLIIFSSLFLFYLTPFEYFKNNFLIKKKIIFIFSIFLILLILNYFEIFNYLNTWYFGGGVILKFNKILFEENLIFFLFYSSFGIFLIFKYLSISIKNRLLFLSLLIFCFPAYILQEYFEPLFLIVFFTLFDLEKNKFETFKKNKTIFIFCIYFSIYYFGSLYYRYNINPIS